MSLQLDILVPLTITLLNRYILGVLNVISVQYFLQGELEHHRVKYFYPRVSKANFTSGIAKQQQRERILFRLAEHELPSKSKRGKAKVIHKRQRHTANNLSKDLPSIPFEASEPLAYSDPKAHYHIASSTRYFLNVQQWLGRHPEDRALEVIQSIIVFDIDPRAAPSGFSSSA
jgi:hypothetical protein